MRKRFFFSLNEMAKPHKRANDSVKVCAFPNNDCTMGKYESTRTKFSFKESKCLIKKTCWNHKRKKKNKEKRTSIFKIPISCFQHNKTFNHLLLTSAVKHLCHYIINSPLLILPNRRQQKKRRTEKKMRKGMLRRNGNSQTRNSVP